MSLTGSARAHHCKSLNLNCYWVCVVVVELAGTAGVVVVVLVVVVGAAGVAQPDSDDAMTTAAKHAKISFFISIIFVWFVTLPARKYAIGSS
jgi:Na+/phosphate symporter